MAWRDQLQPASFRGVPFEVHTSAQTAGRRLARHEYPQRDIPFMEDMGRRAREYKVEAFIFGPDYMSGRDALLAAIEQEGPGQFVDRYSATKLVTVTECELTESTEFGGMAKFKLTFVEAGEQVQPTVATDTAANLTATQDAAFDAIADDFENEFSIDGLPSWGVADIQSSVNGFLHLDDFQQVASDTARFKSKVGSLLDMPGSFASQMIGLVRSLTRVQDLLDRPFVPVTFASGSVASKSSRGVVQRQQAATTTLIKRAAIVQHAGLASNAALATSDAVQAARADILRVFDEHDYASGVPRPSAAVALQMKAVRTAALAHLSTQSAALPRSYTVQLSEPQPALVLSYALYGDLRDAEIVQRNAIRHPGFLPAGEPIQLTA